MKFLISIADRAVFQEHSALHSFAPSQCRSVKIVHVCADIFRSLVVFSGCFSRRATVVFSASLRLRGSPSSCKFGCGLQAAPSLRANLPSRHPPTGTSEPPRPTSDFRLKAATPEGLSSWVPASQRGRLLLPFNQWFLSEEKSGRTTKSRVSYDPLVCY